MQGQTHTRPSVEIAKVRHSAQRQRGQKGDQSPRHTHDPDRARELHVLDPEGKYDRRKPMEGDDGETEHGELAGECGEEAGKLAETTVTPCFVMNDVITAVIGVDAGDDEEVDAHQHVTHG